MKQITFKHWSKRKFRSELLGSLTSNFSFISPRAWIPSILTGPLPSPFGILDPLLFIYTHNTHPTIHQTVRNCHQMLGIPKSENLRQKRRRKAKVREGEVVGKKQWRRTWVIFKWKHPRHQVFSSNALKGAKKQREKNQVIIYCLTLVSYNSKSRLTLIQMT